MMGVSGSGKSAVGQALADRLGWPMLEGDDFHPPANVEKMRRGEALDDEDRRPWLDAMVAAMRGHGDAVVTCSALKRKYRERLREAGDVRFVFLDAGPVQLAQRLADRKGHFFSPALLDSQLATLERPDNDEALILKTNAHSEVLAEHIVRALDLTSSR